MRTIRNEIEDRKKVEKQLKNRKMIIGNEGTVFEPPKRKFKTLYEEVLWIISITKIGLTAERISKYLCIDIPIIQKIINDLTIPSTKYIKEIKDGLNYLYIAKCPTKIDIPTLYETIKILQSKIENKQTRKEIDKPQEKYIIPIKKEIIQDNIENNIVTEQETVNHINGFKIITKTTIVDTTKI